MGIDVRDFYLDWFLRAHAVKQGGMGKSVVEHFRNTFNSRLFVTSDLQYDFVLLALSGTPLINFTPKVQFTS